jgi:phage/plasmid-like protein (TIGR03299 family)
MSSDLLIENGRAALMYVGDPPWHGLGQKLDKPATAAEALSAAHLDWEVTKVPVYAVEGDRSLRLDRMAVVRKDQWGSPTCPFFGLVAPNYDLLQNWELFAFFDPIVGEGAAIYHTAGALDRGARVWILAKLPDSITVVGDDITDKYLLLTNTHDGKSSVQVKFTPVRVVCSNTLIQALAAGPSLRVPHTRQMRNRLAIARDNLGLIRAHYAEIEIVYKAMAVTPVDKSRLSLYVSAVLPEPKKKDDHAAIERVLEARHAVTRLFEHGYGNQLKGVAGTLWAAYNGVTEHVDHSTSRRDGAQHLKHIWYGDGADLKVKAFTIAVKQMCQWNPTVKEQIDPTAFRPV